MLVDRLPSIRGSYRSQADLSKTTWFRLGGPAEVLFRPEDTEDLAHFLAQIEENIPVTILGVGSNILVRDGGIDGVVIRLGRGFAGVKIRGDHVEAGAGALCFNVAMAAQQAGIGGLEFLSGIPGTIGGALQMNAGAYGGDVASVLIEAEAVDQSGSLHRLLPEDIGYVYRGNTLPEDMIFTKGIFKGVAGQDKAEIQAKIDDITSKRGETQPIKSRTGGSTFKNPQGQKAWELIDRAGCRGLKMGGAQVSEQHCNFMINTGDATAKDMEMLGEEVRQKVKEKTGVTLQWEIKIIGKPHE